VIAIVAERRLRTAPTRLAQNRLARDSWGVLHGLLIAGIVLIALGIKKTLGDVSEPLEIAPAVALCGGVALYFLGHVAIRLRTMGSLNRQRALVAILALALIPYANSVDALAALLTLAALASALVAYEALSFRESRARIRAERQRAATARAE
jgi:low temperature requirement protein LtrA